MYYMEPDNIVKLDIKDRKILSILERNSRTPASIMGRKVGLSKSRVIGRIMRIVKSGLIERFILDLNYAALGITTYGFYFKFENTPEHFEQIVAQYLYTHGAVRWFCLTQGEWDLIVRFFANGEEEIERFEDGFMNKFGDHVAAKVFCISLFDTNHLCTQLTGNEGSYYHQTKKYHGGPMRISKQDYRVLFWLYENSRISLNEIAQKEGMSPNVVAYHVRKLEQMEAYFAYSVRFDRAKLGFISAKALLNMRRITPQRRDEFLAYCDALPIVSHYRVILGAWDAEIDVDVKNIRELYVLLRDMRNRFPDLIRSFSVLTKIKQFEANPFATLAGKKIAKENVPNFTI